MVSTENSFSPKDLLLYAEALLKECKHREVNNQQCATNYGWLTARHIQNESINTDEQLDILRPMIQKMSSENCAKIAVKLEDLTEGAESTTFILSTFKELLEEEYSIQLMEKNVKIAKESFKKKANKVHPILVPDGREPTVSFIINPSN